MKNACIVGCGAIGPIHANAVSEAENARVYAICDIDKERADKYARMYGAKALYVFEEVLADESTDVVHICTPHYLHKDMAVRALNAGKNIVLEKPAAMTLKELSELEAAYGSSEKKACIMLQNRTNTAVAEMKRIIEENDLGKLLGMTGFMTWSRGRDYYNSGEWRGTWKYEGGGVLINQSMHLIDLIDWLGGGVEEIKVDLSNKNTPGVEIEDTAEVLCKLKNGARAVFYATNAFTLDVPFRVEMFFEKATLRYADNKLYKIGDTVEILADDVQITDGKKCWGGGHRKVIADFYSALENDTCDYIDLTQGIHSARLMLSMYKSGVNVGKDWIKI